MYYCYYPDERLIDLRRKRSISLNLLKYAKSNEVPFNILNLWHFKTTFQEMCIDATYESVFCRSRQLT